MRAVAVHLYALHRVAVDVAADVRALFQHEAALSGALRRMGKDRGIESRTDQEIIVFFLHGLTFLLDSNGASPASAREREEDDAAEYQRERKALSHRDALAEKERAEYQHVEIGARLQNGAET